MLNRVELNKFYKAVDILDCYFDFNDFDTDLLDKVVFFGKNNNLEGINSVLNRNKFSSADELLDDMFDTCIDDINKKSSEKGFFPIS